MKQEKEKKSHMKLEKENIPETYEIGKIEIRKGQYKNTYEIRNKHIYCIKHKGNCTKKLHIARKHMHTLHV